MKIANRTLLITGANRGIGAALVDEGLRRGAAKIYAGTRGPLRHADGRVTRIALDVTNEADIARAAREIQELDLLVNNAGIALYDDLGALDTIERQLAVNCFGALRLSRAMLSQLERSRGAIANVLSLAALAPVPVIPGYSISKAAALSMTQSLRSSLAGLRVAVHAVFLGPVDTDMNRGYDIPKISPESAAIGILDGLESGEEDIFPDPASRPVADGYRPGIAKLLEREFSATGS